jgi:hypothetical protein
MKIDELLRIQPSRQNPQIQKRGAVGANDFAALLKDEMSNVGETEDGAAVSRLNCLSGVPELAQTTSDPALAGRISAIENVIARLDTLDKALSDDSVSPKKIDCIIQEIGQAAAQLQESVEGLSGGPLAGMSQEVNVLAYMEAVKWRRGDYL